MNSRLNYGYAVVRRAIARSLVSYVLHNACMVDGMKVNVLSAIDMMSESLKRIVLDKSEEKLQLPIILPVESMEGITE